MHVDRRRKRSNYAGLALQYWFASVARRARLLGLVLGDSAGMLVASNIRGPEAEELAALAPLLARDRDPGLSPPDVPVAIKRMQIDRTALFLCAVGGGGQRSSGLRWAESGVHRILTTH